MGEQQNATANTATGNPKLISFSDAARFLGVDTFIFYSIVQREEIPFDLAPNGEFAVLQTDLDKLAKEKSPC